ncbi:MAG: cytochrome c nitrite reductase small subunit [Planctomycetota bacterium]|nr:cytochrome c nitrite reductase small subunit [Planctomycetota bacterium]
MHRRRLLLAVLIGVPLGVGLFTMHYAGGTAYLSSDPQACVNCHIMQGHFDSWQKSSHHGVAVCVDCHLPADFFGKYLAKMDQGWRHSKAFTLQDFHEPIMAAESSQRIVQDNCVRCHSELLHPSIANAATDRDQLSCVHCHRAVGHGAWVALGGPERGEAAERERK